MKRLLIFSGISILALALILVGLTAAGTAPQTTTSISGEPVAGDAHPNTLDGAGKSTLMKILTGVYTRDSGEVLFSICRRILLAHRMKAYDGITFGKCIVKRVY